MLERALRHSLNFRTGLLAKEIAVGLDAALAADPRDGDFVEEMVADFKGWRAKQNR
jgi:hypothetical protein